MKEWANGQKGGGDEACATPKDRQNHGETES
jgi:hypothetical protein